MSGSIDNRGEKFAHYRRLNSLREYVLVSQTNVRVEHYRREADQWAMSEVSGPDSVLHLESIDCHVPVGTIYEKGRSIDLARQLQFRIRNSRPVKKAQFDSRCFR